MNYVKPMGHTAVAAMIVLFAFSISTLAQTTINVPGDQPTIQAGIDTAQNGDTVLVAPGTYYENINFHGKAITVKSSDGPSVTIIDGSANGSVVTFNSGESTNAVLSGFTIQNGQTYYASGGIQIAAASPTITDNLITKNHAIVGIGIDVDSGSPVIKNNTITGNTQIGSGGSGGGGIHVAGSSGAVASPLITGNTITNNSVANGGNGGGISVDYYASPTIQNNVIKNNTAYNNGGGIALNSYTAAVVVQNVVANSTSGDGGFGAGIYVFGRSAQANQIINNTYRRQQRLRQDLRDLCHRNAGRDHLHQQRNLRCQRPEWCQVRRHL